MLKLQPKTKELAFKLQRFCLVEFNLPLTIQTKITLPEQWNTLYVLRESFANFHQRNVVFAKVKKM